MNLFDMSESALESAVNAHYDNLYNRYYHLDEPEPCCKICYNNCGGYCTFEDRDKEVEDDDYCDDFVSNEEDYPD